LTTCPAAATPADRLSDEGLKAVLEGERITKQVTGGAVKYFRHPFLHPAFLHTAFLRLHGYVIAPITMSFDCL